VELKFVFLAASTGIALLSGCSGGSNEAAPQQVSATPTTSQTAASTTAVISGTVATGAASVKSRVTITGTDGNSVCNNDPIDTDAVGGYSCVTKTDVKGPFSVMAIDPNGLDSPMVSLLIDLPKPSANAVANVTPLTTAVLTVLSSNADPYQFATDRAALAAVSGENIQQIVTGLRNQLINVLKSAGVKNPESYDPIQTAFIGGSHSDADLVLDHVKVSLVDGLPALSAIDSDAPPILMAALGQVSTEAVKAVEKNIDFKEIGSLKSSLEKCYSFSETTRVVSTSDLASNLGGKEAEVIAECQSFVGEGFLQNGYRYGQFFFDQLASVDMTSAKFSIPEVVRYITSADGQDEALANFKYVNNRGFQGNFFIPIKKFNNGGWKIYGNQRFVDITVTATLTKIDQLAQDAGTQGTAFSYAPVSGYDTGVALSVNRFGPNGAGLNFVRVKGAGLPAAGLVMVQSSQSYNGRMSIYSKDGVIPTKQVTNINGNIYRMQVADVSGKIIAPPVGVGFNTVVYARLNEVDLKDVLAFSKYSFELFYDTDTSPRHTVVAPMVAPVYPASRGLNRQWHTVAPNTMKYLDPTSLEAQSTPATIPVAWNLNRLASYINNVSVYGAANINGQYVDYSTDIVKLTKIGDTNIAATVMPYGTCIADCVFPQLPTLGGQRQVFLRYKTFDASTVIQITRYN
jgi:hypothetical protein